MPTYEILVSFWRDWRSLTPEQQRAFRGVLEQFIADLYGGSFRLALRVKRVQGYPGVWEMTSAPDGRATFEDGEGSAADPHVAWRRIGAQESASVRHARVRVWYPRREQQRTWRRRPGAKSL